MTDERVHELIRRGLTPHELQDCLTDKIDMQNLRVKTGAWRDEVEALVKRWGIRFQRVRVSAEDIAA